MQKANGRHTLNGQTVSGQSWLALRLLASQVCLLTTFQHHILSRPEFSIIAINASTQLTVSVAAGQ